MYQKWKKKNFWRSNKIGAILEILVWFLSKNYMSKLKMSKLFSLFILLDQSKLFNFVEGLAFFSITKIFSQQTLEWELSPMNNLFYEYLCSTPGWCYADFVCPLNRSNKNWLRPNSIVSRNRGNGVIPKRSFHIHSCLNSPLFSHCLKLIHNSKLSCSAVCCTAMLQHKMQQQLPSSLN